MDIKAVDLNLLVVFAAMMKHRSVTRAAEALNLSQPAMSAALACHAMLCVHEQAQSA